MTIVSAAYVPASADDQIWVITTDDQGNEHWFDEASQDQDWLDYLAGGGTITGTKPTQSDQDDHRLDRWLVEDGSPTKALAKALFTLTNEVRALQGKAALTSAQYKSYLKGLMRG